MEYQAIIYEKHGAIAKVILNRPRYKNAQSRLMIEEMDHAFAAASADDDVRVIVLSAAGDTFSSGHDIGTPKEKEDMRRRRFPKGVRGEYARRLKAQQDGLAAICAAADFGFAIHRTDHPPEAALLGLYLALTAR